MCGNMSTAGGEVMRGVMSALFLLSYPLQVTQIEECCAKNLVASHVELNKVRGLQWLLSLLKRVLRILEKLYSESGL